MSTRPTFFAFASVAAFTMSFVALAEPAHADVVVSGGVQVHAGVTIGAGYGPPPPPPVYYAPPPPPVYDPPPPAYYVPPPCAEEPALARPRFGIGLYASSTEVGEGAAAIDGAGGGVSLRLRFGDHLELEGLIGQDHFTDVPRVDTRVGAAAIYNFGHPGGLRPYVLLGTGLNVIDPTGDTADQNPDAELPTQGYVEAGLGLSWEITRSLVIAAEWRVQARELTTPEGSTTSSARGVTVPPSTDPGDADRETAAEGRLSATVWF
jgi:hypothetical protein